MNAYRGRKVTYFNMKWFCLLIIVSVNQVFGHVAADHIAGRSHLLHNTVRNLFVNENQHFTPAPRHTRPYAGSCVDGSECVNFVSCPAHVRLTAKRYCELIGGSKGICCKTGQNHSGKTLRSIRQGFFVNQS